MHLGEQYNDFRSPKAILTRHGRVAERQIPSLDFPSEPGSPEAHSTKPGVVLTLQFAILNPNVGTNPRYRHDISNIGNWLSGLLPQASSHMHEYGTRIYLTIFSVNSAHSEDFYSFNKLPFGRLLPLYWNRHTTNPCVFVCSVKQSI